MRYAFHPEALDEYLEATAYYREQNPASPNDLLTLSKTPFSAFLNRPPVGESSKMMSAAA